MGEEGGPGEVILAGMIPRHGIDDAFLRVCNLPDRPAQGVAGRVGGNCEGGVLLRVAHARCAVVAVVARGRRADQRVVGLRVLEQVDVREVRGDLRGRRRGQEPVGVVRGGGRRGCGGVVRRL